MGIIADDWSEIDHQGLGADVSRYLLLSARSEVEIKHNLHSLLKLKGHELVLDAGCGIGIDALELAKMVPQGSVVGVDLSQDLISRAKARASAGGVSNLEFVPGDLQDIDLGTKRFDALHCQRTLQHIRNSEAALRNLLRMVKAGGRVVLYEPDQASTIIHPGDESMNKRMVELFSAGGVHKGMMGRMLPSLAKKAGLGDMEIYAFSVIFRDFDEGLKRIAIHPDQLLRKAADQAHISQNELDEWIADLRSASRSGDFFTANINVAVLARA